MEAMLERAIAESAAAAAVTAAVSSAPQPGPVVPSAEPPREAVANPLNEEERRLRRQALAMRLTGGRGMPDRTPLTPSPKPNPLQYANPQAAMDALKRRYEERMEGATHAHAQRYIAAGEEALAKKDIVAASTAFNLATKFAPGDEVLAAKAQEITAEAEKTMTESYLKQATYEERQGHWEDAARSWLRVANLRGEATDHERAANAIFRSAEGDLHEAAEHAKKAIALVPDRAENHLTLVEVYLKAGLTTSAKRTAEAALQLDPKHPSLLAALKRIGKP
jgi:tetratricopeptide (TPR) repeat protein